MKREVSHSVMHATGCWQRVFHLVVMATFVLVGFLLFWRNKSRFMRSLCCLCVSLLSAIFWFSMRSVSFQTKIGNSTQKLMCIRSLSCLCVCVPPVVARQRTVCAVMSLIIFLFSMPSVSYRRKVDYWFFPDLLSATPIPSLQCSLSHPVNTGEYLPGDQRRGGECSHWIVSNMEVPNVLYTPSSSYRTSSWPGV